jgi:glycosyltransferase involved in cell wall biosynthesis
MNNGRVRVLVNALHAKSGGGATYAANMLPKLAAHGDLDVHVVAGHGQDLHGLETDGLTLHAVDAPTGLMRLAAFEQMRVPALARRVGADVVFSPANYGPVFARRSVILLRNAMGVGLIDRRLRQRLYWAAVYAATAASVLRARRVMAVSDFAAASGGSMIRALCADKLDIVHHGVNPAFRPPEADAPREDFLLCVSDLYVQKNMLGLIDAVALLKQRGLDAPLRIAGAPVDRAYADSLKRRAEDRGVSDRVAFLGSVDRDALVGLYQRCAVFVFPSFVETFGNPLVEAMACGAPVATSNTAAMPEVAADAAAYFDPLDPAAMAGVLARILQDETYRAGLSAASLKRGADFSWDRAAEQTAAVLLDAVRS